jgi:two-component system, NarL family, invasion response regulator UvrY
MKLNILIADDHVVVRKGIKQILAEELIMANLTEVASAEEVMEAVNRQKFDLVISDISMQGRSGIELVKQLQINHPEIPVLILSIHPEKQYAMRALKAGAAGYLNKGSASKLLVKAIEQVLKGKKYITPELADILVENLTGTSAELPHELLSDREFEVFEKLAQGKTLAEIATSLSISVSTVSTYRSRVLEKMNLNTNADLTKYAIAHHLI